MTDCIGVDQSYPFTAAALATATGVLPAPPPFWGRYFKTRQTAGGVQYKASENALFSAANLKLLPVARQTAHVDSTDPATASADGRNNAEAMIDALGPQVLSGNQSGVLVFLDVEPGNPMSHTYYENWASALMATGSALGIKFVPAVYGHHNSAPTWAALGKAMGNGAPCEAAWIVYETTNDFPVGPWKPQFQAAGMPAGVRTVLAQRILDKLIPHKGTFDFDLVNPAFQDWFLARMVVPQ